MKKQPLKVEHGIDTFTLSRADRDWKELEDGEEIEWEFFDVYGVEEAFYLIDQLNKFVKDHCLSEIEDLCLISRAQKEWIQDGTLNPPKESGKNGETIYRMVGNEIDEQLAKGSWIQTMSNQLVEALDKLKGK